MYAPNAESQYQHILDEVGVAFQKIISAESIVLLNDFNAYVGTDKKTWKGVIRRQGDFNTNKNGRCLVQFCSTKGLCIMNIFFQHKGIYKCIWYRDSVGHHSIIDFCSVSADFFLLWSICIKRGAKLSIEHHLVVCILRGLNHLKTRKRIGTRRAYRIKWELLAD